MADLPGRGSWLADGLVLGLFASAAAVLGFRFAGTEPAALGLAAWLCIGAGVLALGPRLKPGREAARPGWHFLGVVLFGILVLTHQGLPVPPAHDRFFEEQWAFFAERRAGNFLPLDAGLRGLWVFALAFGFAGLVAVLRDRPSWLPALAWLLAIPGLTAACFSGLDAPGTGIWERPGTYTSDRAFGPFFHDNSAVAWMNLLLALGTAGALRLRLVWLRRGVVLGLILLVGRLQWLPKSDASVPLFFACAATMLLALFWSGAAANRKPRSPGPRAFEHAWQPRLLAVGCALLMAGVLLDRRAEHPPLEVVGSGLSEQVRGEDRLLPSADPRAGRFLGDQAIAREAAAKQFLAAPLTGWGPVGWALHLDRFTRDPLLRSFILYAQFTHNDPLQFLVHWGIVGLLALVLLLQPILARGWRSILGAEGAADRGIALCVAGGTAVVLVQGLIQSPAQMPLNQVIGAGLLALIAATGEPARPVD